MLERLESEGSEAYLHRVVSLDLGERLRYWQGVLRLQDWDIELRRVAAREMPDCWAQIETDETRHRALIRVVNDDDSGESSATYSAKFDAEHELLHELIHMVLRYWEKPDAGSIEYRMRELACNRLADVLLAFERK